MPELIDGRYEILEKIKEGGMGSIFKVRHVLLDEVRVIKTLRPHIEEDPEAQKRFIREAKMATGLSHPNIAAVHDFVEDRVHGGFYMVMDYIQGSNLAELLAKSGKVPLVPAIDIMVQTLDALGYLHRRGIIHRDVSPENIMLTEEAGGELRVKLIDLGVAKDVESEGMTRTGIFVGKLRYGSPEQMGALKKGEKLDGRSDVYSLGAVLYVTLTGRQAIEGATPQAFITAHLMHGPKRFDVTDAEGAVPEDLRRVVLRAMARNREDRYQTAEELATALLDVKTRLLEEAAREEPKSRTLKLDQEQTLALYRELRRAREAARQASSAIGPASAGGSASRTPGAAILGPGGAGDGASGAAGDVAMRSPIPSGSSPRRLALALLAGAVLVLTGVGLFVSRQRSGPPPTPPPAAPPGFLEIDARPWATVLEVSRAAAAPGGSREKADTSACPATPCRLTLSAGRWEVLVELPSPEGGSGAGPKRTATADVSAGAAASVVFRDGPFDPEAALAAYGLAGSR